MFKLCFWLTVTFSAIIISYQFLKRFILVLSLCWIIWLEKSSTENLFCNLRVWSEMSIKLNKKCIPVGCVPTARRPYAGVCFPGGCGVWSGGVGLVRGGLCLVQGGCLVWGSVWSGGVPGPGGGGLVWGGVVCLVWGGLPQYLVGYHPPCGQTDACENITLAQLCCGR